MYPIVQDVKPVYNTPVDDREDKSCYVDPRIWHQWLDFISPKVLSVRMVIVYKCTKYAYSQVFTVPFERPYLVHHTLHFVSSTIESINDEKNTKSCTTVYCIINGKTSRPEAKPNSLCSE